MVAVFPLSQCCISATAGMVKEKLIWGIDNFILGINDREKTPDHRIEGLMS